MDVLVTTGAALPDALPADGPLALVLPATDLAAARRAADLIARRAGCAGLVAVVEDLAGEGFVAIANRTFRATRTPLFGYVAQDAFAGRNWGVRAVEAFRGGPQRGLLALNDGKWNGLLAAFGIVRRSWAERNYAGDLFHAGYFGHYADVELTLVALQQKALAYDPNCVMVEVDYDKDGKAVYGPDREAYFARRGGGFDGRVTEARLLSLFG